MTESHQGGVQSEGLRDHVIVASLKGVGLRVVELLHLSSVPVAVVDDDPNERRAGIVKKWGVPYLSQGSNLRDCLLRAGLDRASAVICADTDELATLEIALWIREKRPDVRLVVQMENSSVADALRGVIEPGAVLNSAVLTAPSFVEVCLHQNHHSLELEGRRFDVVQSLVDGDHGDGVTFRQLFGALAPVAITPGDGSDMALCPGRDHLIKSGDMVAVLGTPEELDESSLNMTSDVRSKVRKIPFLTRLNRRFSDVTSESTRGVFTALMAIGVLIVISTVVVRLAYRAPGSAEHLNVLSSLYFVVETVATVGFGDFSFARQEAWLQVFAIFLIIIGVTLTTVTFVLFTNLLVGRRIDQSLGRRQVPRMAGHVIVIGLGSIGVDVVDRLVAEGTQVVVVERDDTNRYLSRVRALDVPVVIADATQRQTLSMVNLAHASAVIVLTSDDFTNIETALAVRDTLGDRWQDIPVVFRVLDRNLAQTMERSFGFRYVRSTAALAAPWFVGAALGLDVIATFFIDRQPFLVGRLPIAPGGGLQGLAMQDLSAQTRVIGIRRDSGGGTFEHPPRRGTRFEGGDQAYLLGPDEEILRVLRQDQRDLGAPAT